MEFLNMLRDMIRPAYHDTSYNFFVVVGPALMSFSKISGLVLSDNKNFLYTEGGAKYPHVLAEKPSESNRMVLEKGYSDIDMISVLDTLEIGPKLVLIICLDSQRNISAVYFASDARIEKMTLSDLDAQKSGILIKTTTIAYSKLMAIPLAGLIPGKASGAAIGALDFVGGESKKAEQASSSPAPWDTQSGTKTAKQDGEPNDSDLMKEGKIIENDEIEW